MLFYFVGGQSPASFCYIILRTEEIDQGVGAAKPILHSHTHDDWFSVGAAFPGGEIARPDTRFERCQHETPLTSHAVTCQHLFKRHLHL